MPAPALTLGDIVARLGGEALGDVRTPLSGVATLDAAGPADIAFLANPKYRGRLATTRAGAVILGPGDRDAATMPRIVSANPYAYYARTVALFHPEEPVKPGVDPLASVDPSARVDPSAGIEAFAVVGPAASVGAGARIGAHCSLGRGASVGAGTRLHPRVTVYDGCSIGARCILHSGAVVGADGFGMARAEGRWLKIPQVGAVRIGDDVEVGANTTIDRGALGDTVIGDGVKLDNQVQVGHNCVIGAHTVIAGCAGLAGSVTVGRDCMIGGAAGLVGHISICDGVTVSAFTLVTKSITRPGTYTGIPFMPHAEYLRNAVHLRHLDELAAALRPGKAGDDRE